MVFIFIGIIIIFCGIKNYKYGLIIYLGFKLFLVNNISIISIPNFPLLTLEDFMNIIFVLIYFLKRSKKEINICEKFEIPWQLPFIVLTISIFFSTIFGKAGVIMEFTAFIKYTFENILLIMIIWNVLNTEEDFKLAFNIITMIMIISAVFGIMEYKMQFNPLKRYESTLINDETKKIEYTYSEERRGYRVNSIFSHPIGAGINWAIYVFWVIYIYINNKKIISNLTLMTVTAICCVICIFLTKMRTPIIFLIISLFGVLNFKKRRTYWLLLLFSIILFFLIFDETTNVSNVFLSLFSKKNSAIVGGSNLEMRLEQIKTAFKLAKKSPIVGLGSKYQNVLEKREYIKILGSEGMILYVLPSYGFLGLLAYWCLYNYSIIKIPRFFKSKQLSFLMLGYFITYLISSVPGFKIHLLYIVSFYLIKDTEIYKNFQGKRKKEFNI